MTTYQPKTETIRGTTSLSGRACGRARTRAARKAACEVRGVGGKDLDDCSLRFRDSFARPSAMMLFMVDDEVTSPGKSFHAVNHSYRGPGISSR